MVVALLLLLLPLSAHATDEAMPNTVFAQIGGQIEIREYKSWLKLTAGYARWITGPLWLELGASALVHKESNLGVLGGLRWKFGAASTVRGFLRTDLEVALLLEPPTRVAVAPRVGGGVGYHSSPGFGATLEAGLALGPVFGGGVHFGSALDLLFGVEFLF
jgi:hypothetical protein